jgi:uncharacterized protein (DUF58 family)
VTGSLSDRVPSAIFLAGLGLLSGILFHRIDLVALGAPFALLALAGLVTSHPPPLDVRLEVPRDRAVEGDQLELRVRLASPVTIPRVEVVVDPPSGLARTGSDPVAVRLAGGTEEVLDLPLTCDRWGTYRVAPVHIRVRDRGGVRTWHRLLEPVETVRVHPAPDVLRTLVRPYRTQSAAGNQVATTRASGIEPADLRGYQPGDRPRDIHWRATARRGDLWVQERHPERATEVVVFLDSFSTSGFERAVRAASAIVDAHLGERDRVGLVTFGATVSWVRPGSGGLQRMRVIDHLLGRQVWSSTVMKGIGVVPPTALPPRSLVLALSPLEDERTLAGLADLRNRGIDVAIIEVAPTLPEPPAEEPSTVARLWQLRRDVVRDRFRRLGVAVVEWSEGRPVESVLTEAEAFRRRGRRMVR